MAGPVVANMNGLFAQVAGTPLLRGPSRSRPVDPGESSFQRARENHCCLRSSTRFGMSLVRPRIRIADMKHLLFWSQGDMTDLYERLAWGSLRLMESVDREPPALPRVASERHARRCLPWAAKGDLDPEGEDPEKNDGSADMGESTRRVSGKAFQSRRLPKVPDVFEDAWEPLCRSAREISLHVGYPRPPRTLLLAGELCALGGRGGGSLLWRKGIGVGGLRRRQVRFGTYSSAPANW